MKLDIIVCVKSVIMQVPGKKNIRTEQTCELNPFDRPALEMALQLRDAYGGHVTTLSMGPTCCTSALCETMAMGADRGVLLCDPALAGSDTLATSTALAAAIHKLAPFDLVVFGTRTADSDTGQVGPQTAVALELPLISGVHTVSPADGGLEIERRSDGFLETFHTTLPAVLTIHPDALVPRDMGLWNLESAFTKPTVTQLGLFDLGLTPNQVGETGSPTRVLSMEPVQRQRKCEFLSGSSQQQADTLVKRLCDAGLIE